MRSPYWFAAKRYGWGWGLPLRWEGWAVSIVFLAAIFAGPLMFPPRRAHFAYLIYFAVCTCVLLLVCWWKGEPPRWRWGDRK